MLKVFMSYTSVDQARVKPLYAEIEKLGFKPWMDCEKLLPGQNWSPQIDHALADANVVILFISKASLSKRGFVQREANQAFENLKSKRHDDIYIIPVLLEPCEVPKHISDRLQFIELSTPNAWSRITKSLELAAEQQEIISENGADHGPFQIFEEDISEEWHGNPGYDVQISYPRFESQTLPAVASTLTNYFAGRTHGVLINSRVKPWEQEDEEHTFGSDNGRWDAYSASFSHGQFLSVYYTVGWYGAGAAHPNSHFECHNFVVMNSKIYPVSLKDLFEDWEAVREPLRKLIIKEIQKEYWDRTGEFPNAEEQGWIAEGVGQVDTDCFAITDSGLAFFYSPYIVAPYALGSFSADIPMYAIKDYIAPRFAALPASK